MTVLKVERVGGLAGFGTPGSRIVSRGQIGLNDLAAHDQKAIEALFDAYKGPQSKGDDSPVRDTFRYRISRTLVGREEVIDVPECDVPASLVQCVKDELI
ncbi:hypothetical protein EC912_10547 [Luteibacter rhizovicinus]|uniref:Uncharacterized protein n=1 Tax=Luteibacter rhizovicinus TaxID=242606 RepID=A0A4R3YKX5_9GAMM|nr:protealysin inhibitor emfourin [Luteibacter rhizovicinus]TCV93187.1 hypothetical protein EC912_10547 [Luteibacter rhizovicinus]